VSDTASGMPRREELDEVLELVAREATTYLRGVDARNARMPHAARAAASFVAPLPDEGVGATVALRELLKLYGDVADPPGRRRRHVHRGLVALQSDQRIFGRDAVARLHVDFDDLDVFEFADIGDANVEPVAHRVSRASGDRRRRAPARDRS